MNDKEAMKLNPSRCRSFAFNFSFFATVLQQSRVLNQVSQGSASCDVKAIKCLTRLFVIFATPLYKTIHNITGHNLSTKVEVKNLAVGCCCKGIFSVRMRFQIKYESLSTQMQKSRSLSSLELKQVPVFSYIFMQPFCAKLSLF